MPISAISVTFKGGDKYKGLLARIAAQNVGVKAGILAGATKADGTKVAYYAAVNEFGGTSVIEGHTVRIPPRPFMRDTVRGSSNEWGRLLSGTLSRHPDGAKAAMYIIGQRMADDIQATIQAGNFQPLSPKTIERKAKEGKKEPATPLIDTGTMLKSVNYEVVSTKGGEAE